MRSISASAISGFVRAMRRSSGTRAFVIRSASPVQLSGRNRRKPIITGTSSRASVSDTSVWQLAVLPSAEAYCGATPTECEPFFGGAVSSKRRKGCASADQLVRLDRKFLFQQRFVPDAARNEMMQLVVVAGRPSRRHRLDALAVARPNQPSYVERTHPSARLVPKPRQERRKPPQKVVIPSPCPSRSAKIGAQSFTQPQFTYPQSAKVVIGPIAFVMEGPIPHPGVNWVGPLPAP